MNNTCAGSCAHDAGCKTAGLTSSELDAHIAKFLDKLQPIPNDPNANTRMGVLSEKFSD